MKAAEPPDPPQPPPFQRRIQIGWLQVVGVTLLLLLPLAALTGLLGTEEREVSASGDPLELTARYPSRMHYLSSETLEVRVTNSGTSTLAGVTVLMADDYLSHFEAQQFRPQVARVSERGAEVDLGELPAGQSRRIVVGLRVEDHGRHAGRISAVAEGGKAVSLDVSTLVLP
jgi:hypothetical protein